ncbi:alpha/beta hydrolase fold domain-containing protein [Ruania alba]|uniref:Acetyl esterase/lipase n=1 Tax=Ruania alba TaxID=648782 RepID=A0A1H5M9J3_9MICO|nr:alpha/beta hydrolase fold domain-containing protein [Ruania alba]SEE85823.1 Acetyl esterase/lipase [Ruania alba]
MTAQISRRSLLAGGAAAAGVAAAGLCGVPFATRAAANVDESSPVVYKTATGKDLLLHRWEPEGSGARPSIVFFHGGGWRIGNWTQFEWLAQYFASRGMRAFSVEYRTEGPVPASEDAVDALNHVITHADELGVDPHRLVAAGASAGGHLAAATAFLTLPNTQAGVRPAALALLNPVTDTTGRFPAGYGRQLFDDAAHARSYSPVHHITSGGPPTLILHGTGDEVVHVDNSAQFIAAMREVGNEAELVTFDGQPHGFTNVRPLIHNPYGFEGARQLDRFLCELGFLDGHQDVRPEPGQLLSNGDFTRGLHGWSTGTGTSVRIASGTARIDQDDAAGGLSCDVTDALRARGRGAYLMGARVSDASAPVELALVVTDSAKGDTRSFPLGPVPGASSDGRIAGTREITWEGRLESARLVAKALDGGTFDLEDVTLEFLPATVMRYSMADAASGTLTDGSGFGHDVSATALTTVADGVEGVAASFDGEGSWARLKQLGRAAIPGIGIHLWLRPDAPTGQQQVILDGGDGDAPWLSLDPVGRLGTALGDAPLSDTSPLPTGEWTQVHLTLDQHEVRLSIADRVVSTSGRSTLQPGIVTLGRPVDLSQGRSGFRGDIDEVEVDDFPAPAPLVTSGITVRAAVGDLLLPGGRATAAIRALNGLDDAIRDIELSLTPPSGWASEAVPDLPRLIEAGSTAESSWSLAVPETAEPGVHTGALTLAYATGGQTARHTLQIAFTVPEVAASLPAAFTNVATSDEAGTVIGAFTDRGHSYSREALAEAGLAPGASVTGAGLTFTWPDTRLGEPDNVALGGEYVRLSGHAHALAFLGASAYSTYTASGEVFYTDGGSAPFDLTLPNWRAMNSPAGSELVASTPSTMRRGEPEEALGNIFATAIPLDPDRQLLAVRLPANERMHVFAMAAGSP